VVSDIEYDLLSMLQSKLEGLEAYEMYLQDAEEAGEDGLRRLIEEIQQDDEKHAARLREELARVLTSSGSR
jgi:hypothetical protein